MIEQINQLLVNGDNRKAAQLIRTCIANKMDLAGNNIRYAHILALDCDWESVTNLLPPEMNVLDTSGWLRSLKAGRPIDNNGLPIPWLTYAAIDFIGSKINPQMRVFEWGAGNSTLWFASKVKEVVSTEDNVEWYQELRSKLPQNVKLSCSTSTSEYVGSILNDKEKYDVIVIDGSHRNECSKVCIERLAENGFVVFDNSDSAEFDESMIFFNTQNFYRIDFWGLVPSYLYKNCTTILFRNPDILKTGAPPSQQQVTTGISCFQAYDKRRPQSVK